MRPQRAATTKSDDKDATVVQTRTRTRLAVLRNTRRVGALGVPELAALAVAAVLLVVAIVAYFSYLAPQRTRLATLGQERERLERRLRETTDVNQQHKDTGALVADIVNSLERFETGALAGRDASSTAIVEELNQKTAHNSLARAQFSFTHQDELTGEQMQQQLQRLAAAGGATGAARTRKRQNVFPGIDISLTVEGAYSNIRRFVRDVEASRRFIVVNGVELEGVTDAGASRTAESNVPRGQLVSLRLDMSAYFRRAAAQSGDATGPTGGTSQ